MNNKRRKQIEEIIEKLEVATNDLNLLMSEEQDAFDNLPSSFQEGETGQKMEEAISNIEYAISDIESVVTSLQDAINS